MKVAIIGVGAMGGAIAAGLLRSGFDPTDLILANPHTDRLAGFADKGVAVTSDNLAAASGADIIILAVKPWIIPEVAVALASGLPDPGAKTIVSVAANVGGDELSRLLTGPSGCPGKIAVVIPNTAASLGASMTFVTPVTGSASEVVTLFERLGAVEVIDAEHLPAAMVVASCGIAFAMRYVRAAMEGAVEIGLKAPKAQEIICHTLRGAAALLLEPGAHPESEIDKVTTPGGLTIRGLNAMEAGGFTPAVIAAHRASNNA